MRDLFLPKNIVSAADGDPYEIRVGGSLDASWSDWFGGLKIDSLENGETLISGVVADQSVLHGLPARIRDTNLKLISVKRKVGGAMSDTLLEVQGLETRFNTSGGISFAVNGVSFGLRDGETLPVVDESGCGKSVTMHSILRLIPSPPGKVVAGRAIYYGQDLLQMKKDEIRQIRGSQVGMIFQDPMTCLNPTLTIERQLTEPLEEHFGPTRERARERAADLLELIGIPRPKERLKDYPHQFSGGMRQRMMIAMALACTPKILIAHEPISALDVSIQAQVVNLLEDLQKKFGLAYLFIAHDISMVRHISDRLAVRYLGVIVELSGCNELHESPLHPYTQALLWAVPIPDPPSERRPKRVILEGDVPSPSDPPSGCRFRTRCPLAKAISAERQPAWREVRPGHYVACHIAATG